MKKIITTVGTSIITNRNLSSQATEDFNELKNKALHQDNYKGYASRLKKEVQEKFEPQPNTSAEIQSIGEIQKKYNYESDFECILIATDTHLSRISAELIVHWFDQYKQYKHGNISFDPDKNIIENLQVTDYDSFVKQGVPNLLAFLYSSDISNNGLYWEDVIFNITGGYKGLIPLFTTIGQLEKVPIYYLFEESPDAPRPALISIPQMPIMLDESIFNNYYEAFEKLEEGQESNHIDPEVLENSPGLIYQEDNTVYLNEFAQIIWKKYKKDEHPYYMTDEVYKEIQNQPNIQRILEEKFWSSQNRRSKTESKNTHKTVFDDGNNPFRIFYFEDSIKIYIYKTFEDHNKYEKYINDKKFTPEYRKILQEKS